MGRKRSIKIQTYLFIFSIWKYETKLYFKKHYDKAYNKWYVWKNRNNKENLVAQAALHIKKVENVRTQAIRLNNLQTKLRKLKQ